MRIIGAYCGMALAGFAAATIWGAGFALGWQLADIIRSAIE